MSTPSPSAASDAPTPATLAQAMGPIPPSAHVLVQLQRLLADLNTGLDDIARLILLDAALTTRIIRLSNSAWFGRGLPCTSIEEAVNRIGFREVYHFVAVAVSSALVAQPVPAYGRDSLEMWTDSVTGAFAAEALARRVGEDAANAYLIGLLHVIGRLPVNRYLMGQGSLTRALADDGYPHEFSGAEFALLGFHQAEVGAQLLAAWEFQPSVTQPVRHQYDPLSAEEPHDRMAVLLYAARLIRIAASGVEIDPEGGDATEAEILGSLALTRADVLALVPGVRETFSRARLMMKV